MRTLLKWLNSSPILFLCSLWPIRKQYKAPGHYNLSEFENNCTYDVDLKPYFDKHLKKGNTANSCTYEVYLSHGTRTSSYEGVYRDAAYNFVFTKRELISMHPYYKSNALACIGFEPKQDGSLIIKQIQGVKGKHEDLSLFRWEKMLINIVMEWARANHFKIVKIIQAKDSMWACNCKVPDCKRDNSMRLHYDVTAKRLGFKFDKVTSCYAMEIA